MSISDGADRERSWPRPRHRLKLAPSEGISHIAVAIELATLVLGSTSVLADGGAGGAGGNDAGGAGGTAAVPVLARAAASRHVSVSRQMTPYRGDRANGLPKGGSDVVERPEGVSIN
jgi:hypothetical protein